MHVSLNSHSTNILEGNGLAFKLLGLPFVAAGLLMVTVVGGEIVTALLAGAYLSTPTLILVHLMRIFFTVLFLGVGLLMTLGGVYGRIDVERREVFALHFYGFFARWMRCSFDDVVQVVISARSTRPSYKRFRQNNSVRRYYTYYATELELRDGRRMKLGSNRRKEQVLARAEQIAAQMGVQVIDIGLIK